MDMKAKRAFISARFGNIAEGQVLRNLEPRTAQQFKDQGLAEPLEYATKVIEQTPTAPKRRRKPKQTDSED